jgi:hypothetical protein
MIVDLPRNIFSKGIFMKVFLYLFSGIVMRIAPGDWSEPSGECKEPEGKDRKTTRPRRGCTITTDNKSTHCIFVS